MPVVFIEHSKPSFLSLLRVQPARALHRGTSGLSMLMRGVRCNGTVCGCPAPRNHMKLASPLVPVLILYVARDCLGGTLIDLSRENETGQPARVKHCRSPSLRCRSRFARRMRLHLAFAHVRPTPGASTCGTCASCSALNLGCERGGGAR